jgi:hypothetical protein
VHAANAREALADARGMLHAIGRRRADGQATDGLGELAETEGHVAEARRAPPPGPPPAEAGPGTIRGRTLRG